MLYFGNMLEYILSKYGDFLKNPQGSATLGSFSIKILFFLNAKFRQETKKTREGERSQVKMGELVKIRS